MKAPLALGSIALGALVAACSSGSSGSEPLGTGGSAGTTYAIRFNPMGWTTQAGKKYSVSVAGVTPAIAYDVNVVDCK